MLVRKAVVLGQRIRVPVFEIFTLAELLLKLSFLVHRHQQTGNAEVTEIRLQIYQLQLLQCGLVVIACRPRPAVSSLHPLY